MQTCSLATIPALGIARMSSAIDLVSFVSKDRHCSRLQNVPHDFGLKLEPSGGVLLELGRCPLGVTTGYPSTSDQCPLSAPKEKLLRATHRSAKCRNLALTCYQRLVSLMSRRNEHVADTAYGANGIGVSRIKFYLSAQTCNP